MLGRRVHGADDREWIVGRRWLPWSPRKRGSFGDAVNALDDIRMGFDFLEGPGGIVATIVVAIVALLFVVFVLPIVLTALEIVLVLALLPMFVIARIVLRKPWIIVARTKGPPPEERTTAVSGWRASRVAMETMIQEIRGRG